MTKSEVLELFLSLLERFTFPAPWDWVPYLEDARMTPASADSLHGNLIQIAPIEDLVTSRIVVVGAAGERSLNPKLSGAHAPVLGLRRAGSDELFDLLTAGGLVCSAQPSAVAALHDQHTVESMAIWEEIAFDPLLLLPADIVETILLRALGFPAALNDGLDPLNLTALDGFRQFFGFEQHKKSGTLAPENNTCPGQASAAGQSTKSNESPSAPESVGDSSPSMAPIPMYSPAGPSLSPNGPARDRKCQPPQLTLVGWNLLKPSLEQPRWLVDLGQEFPDLVTDPELDLFWNISGWFPVPEDLERLKAGIEKRASPLIRKALLKSTEEQVSELPNWIGSPKLPQQTPQTEGNPLYAVHQQLESAFLSHTGAALKDRKAAVVEYRRVADEHLLRPAFDKAMGTADPAKRIQWYRVASLINQNIEDVVQEYEERAAMCFGHYTPDQVREKAPLTHAKDLDRLLKELKEWDPLPMFSR